MRLALLVLVALVSGCASSPPEGRMIRLDAIPAAGLVPDASDLPAGFFESNRAGQTGAWRGLVEGHAVVFRRSPAPNGSHSDEVAVSAFVFETPNDAHAMLSQIVGHVDDAAPRDLGDEAFVASSTSSLVSENRLYLRQGRVAWAAEIVDFEPRERDVSAESLATLLLAKLPLDA